MTLAPDWICEVISPSTGRIDRVKKLPIYARESVEQAWIVDPTLRTLEVFRREGAEWLLSLTASDADLVRAAPFDAIEIDLLALWGETRPAP